MTERFGQWFPNRDRPKERIMYVERETGGFAKGPSSRRDGEKLGAGRGMQAARLVSDGSARGSSRRAGGIPDAPPRGATAGQAREPPPAKLALAWRQPAARVLGAGVPAGGRGGWNFGYRWWTVGRFIEATDDAYVERPQTTWPPKWRATCRVSRSRTIRGFMPAT